MSYLSESQRTWALRILGGSVLVFLWFPLLVMVLLSFGSNAYATFPMGDLTLKWYAAAFSDTDLLMSIVYTLFVATASAILATILGLLGAFALVRREFRLKSWFRVATIVPMIIPGVVLGIALLSMFQTISGGLLSLGTVIIAHSLYTMPFALLTISSRLYSLDETMEEAGRDLGAGRLTVLRTVTLPQLSAAIAAGGLLAFIRSFSEFIRAYFVSGGRTVFTIRIWQMLNHELTPKINAISTVVMFGMIGLLLVVYYVGSGDLTENLYG
ncbi:ABC transporter permease [Halospeciosus flavus]|uniref:ABC transporter permease n=1 Tax=Halospeciosus flavus TaxID=3032283 RepID=A0ABD5Z638_9EURY|nr:ABC transporter permease [Halospeciosus flavus]